MKSCETYFIDVCSEMSPRKGAWLAQSAFKTESIVEGDASHTSECENSVRKGQLLSRKMKRFLFSSSLGCRLQLRIASWHFVAGSFLWLIAVRALRRERPL